MNLDVKHVLQEMLHAATNAFGDEWDQVKTYLPTELRKLAIQIVDISENVAKFEADPHEGYPPETGKILLQMQRNALEAVLTAVTAMTILAVQNAISKILNAVKDAFGGVLKSVLP